MGFSDSNVYLGPDTPAANTYAFGSTIEESISYSIQGRAREHALERTPGPGQYAPRVIERGPAFSISGRRRESSRDSGPGPAQYSPRAPELGAKIAIKGKWTAAAIDDASPGPKYLVPTTLSGSRYGAYETAPAASLGGRPIPRRLRRSDGPGPAAVNLRRSMANNDGPAFTMRPKTNPDFEDRPTPGPIYNIPTTLGDGSRKHTIAAPRAERKLLAGNDTPGPGAYTVNMDMVPGATPRGFSFGAAAGPDGAGKKAAKRGKSEASGAAPAASAAGGAMGSSASVGDGGVGGGGGGGEAAGGGETAENGNATAAASDGDKGKPTPRGRGIAAGPSASLSNSGRTSFVQHTASPGPGAYTIDRNPINTRTGKTMGSRFKDPTATRHGAPVGSYTPGDLGIAAARTPAYSFGLRLKDLGPRNSVPGAGTYDLPSGIGSTTPRYSFGGKDPDPPSRYSNVGPGSYQIKSTLGSSAVTIKGKWPAQKLEVIEAGPGSYDQTDKLYHVTGPVLKSSRPSLFSVPKKALHFRTDDGQSPKKK
jgi:hypothetical protein